MKSGRSSAGIFLSLLLLLTSLPLFGQGIVTGTISGTVVDPQQAVISGAIISAKDPNTNRTFTTTSDESGAFSLRGVPAGTYNLTIEASGFSKVQLAGVEVFVGRVTALGAKVLTVGAAGEVVDVESTAPMVESTSSQVTASFETKKVADLPVGANTGFDALALLVPGVASAFGGSDGFSNTNGAELSSNGQRGRSNNFQIDGQANNDNSVAGPQFFVSNTDTIAEYQVITNNFSAEYGRNMGSVVNYITKSGTNNFHGSAFWYHTSNAFFSLTNQEKSPLLGYCSAGEDPALTGCTPVQDPPKNVDNRWGFTVGGPAIVDKLWFFGSWQHQSIWQSTSPVDNIPYMTPTPAGIAALNAAFPGNPAVEYLNRFGPYSVGREYGNPTPVGTPELRTVTDGVASTNVEFASIRRGYGSPYANREISGRVDWQVTDKDRLFVRHLFQGTNYSTLDYTGLPAMGYLTDVPARTNQIGVDWSRSWTSQFLNQFRWSYSRAVIGFEGAAVLFPECNTRSIFECPTFVAFDDDHEWMGYASNLPQGRNVNNTQFQDNASWVMGRHTLKFGGEYDRQRSPNYFMPNINGSFYYGNFDDFLQGAAYYVALVDDTPSFTFKEQDLAFYFQDDWRVKDNLTLNLGLRWEWNEQAINALHDRTVARETGSSPVWDTTVPLDYRVVAPVPEDKNNFAPNFGFAWTPRIWEGLFGRDKTVIRGGFRIAYDPAFYNMFLNVMSSAPNVNAGTFDAFTLGVPLYPGSGADIRTYGYTAYVPTGSDPRFRPTTMVADDFRNPYTQQWSLGVQRQITPKIAAEVRYAGNHTVGNFQTINANPYIADLFAFFPDTLPAGVTPCTDAAAPGFGRLDCNRARVRERRNSAYSIYHGMQNRLDINGWHGLTAGVGYTWSKTIDNASEIFTIANGGIAGAMDPFDPGVKERGTSSFSYPHVFTSYWIYDLPWYKSQEGMVGKVLGGWQVSGAYRYQSGTPWTPRNNNVNAFCDTGWGSSYMGAASGVCRPILNNEAAPLGSVGRCTNAAALDCGIVDVATGLGTTLDAVHWIINNTAAALFFGDPYLGVGRNTLRGQDINNMDFAIFKNTKITEKLTIQFQANAFNVLNRQFRGLPGNRVEFAGDPADGATFANDLLNNSNRRYLIFGLKLIF